MCRGNPLQSASPLPRPSPGTLTAMDLFRDAVTADCLKFILYFDVFNHPLATAELARLVAPDQPEAVERALGDLERLGLVTRQGRLCHRPARGASLGRRESRARAAERLWPAARDASALLSSLPFVRGVLITGGLSKNSATPDGDVDFLLLVEPGRVWTLKTLLQGLRRPLPEVIRRLFCTNYLLDLDHLEIDDKNLFTAVELVTAVPMAGPEAAGALLDANPWVASLVPGLSWARQRAANAAPLPARRLARGVEALWRGPLSRAAEREALALWQRYWDRKYDWIDPAVRAQRFKRREEIATNHLHDFQDYVLREVGARLDEVGLEVPLVFDGPRA